MASNSYIQLVQFFIYVVSLILSVVFFLSMIFNVAEFQGKCLLFTTGTFNESDGRIFEPKWASFFNCGLTLFNGTFLSIASAIQSLRMFKLFSKGLKGSIISTFWDSVVAFIVVILILVNSILVTIGFNKWCNSLTQNFESCEDTADSNVMIIANTDINPERFYLQMGVVHFGLWVSLVTWVLTLVISSLSFYEYHEKENLIISMARERRRYETIEEE